MKHCFKKQCVISVLAVFAFLWAYECLVHGFLLKDLYMQTASLWRPEEEMKQYCWLVLLKDAVLAMVFTCLFKKFRKGYAACKTDASPDPKCNPATTCCPIKSGGLCFGLKLGLILGVPMGICYVWMPIPAELAIAWFFAGLFEGIGVGVVLGMLCKDKNTCNMQGA